MKKNKKTIISSVLAMAGFGLLVGLGTGFIFDKLNIGGLIEVLSRFLS